MAVALCPERMFQKWMTLSSVDSIEPAVFTKPQLPRIAYSGVAQTRCRPDFWKSPERRRSVLIWSVQTLASPCPENPPEFVIAPCVTPPLAASSVILRLFFTVCVLALAAIYVVKSSVLFYTMN